MLLEVQHDTHYDYGAPVTLAHHLAYLQPLQDEHQQLLGHELSIGPAADWQRAGHDARGNACCWFGLAQAHDALHVTAISRVRLQPRFAALQADASPPWDELAQQLRYVARAPYDTAVEFAQPSPYVPRLPELAAYAAPTLQPGRPVAQAAIELMQRFQYDFEYRSASTQIDTPLAQAFAQKRGVCQDFAHLMAGALRMHGLPVRYVSGYLLTQPVEADTDDAQSSGPEGANHPPALLGANHQPALLGADASHAWVQVYCPRTPGVPADGWLDLDPTNNLIPGDGHVRVAVGRDFGDVTPLRGVIRGGGPHGLTVAVRTRRLD